MIFSHRARGVFAELPLFGIMAFSFGIASPSLPIRIEYRTIIDEGNLHRHKGEFLKAIEKFNEAMSLSRAEGDDRVQLDCLLNLGILNWDIGKVKESNDLFRQARELSQKLGFKDQEERCSDYLKIYEAYVRGKEACASGLHQESIDQFEIAIDLARKIGSLDHELKCLRQMSMNYHQISVYNQFSDLNNRALIIAKRIKHKSEEARCLNNIGISFYANNDYSRALIHYGQALSLISNSTGNDYDLSAVLNNIGAAYLDLGDFDKAISYLSRALEIDRNIDDREGISLELRNLAATYRRRRILSKNKNDAHISLKLDIESLELARKSGNKEYEVAALNNIGLAHATERNYDEALKYFHQALSVANVIGYLSEACNVHANMGFAFIEKCRSKEAEVHFRKALEIVIKTGRDELLWEIYFGLGQCLERREQNNEALASYKKAIESIDLIRSRLALDNFKAGFLRDKIKAYEALLNLLSMLKRREDTIKYDPEIFEFIEKAKARAFLEELGRTDRLTPSPAKHVYKNEEEALSKRISRTLSALISPDQGAGQREKLLSRLELEEDDYANLLNRIKTEEVDASGISSPQVISAGQLKKEYLDETSALLEYFLGERKSYGFLISKNDFILRELPPRAEVEDSLRAYLKLLSSPPKGGFQGIPAARRIYQDFVFPFEAGLSPHITHLIFVPDGILHYLPFETLVRDDSITHEPRYLIELYDISYAPSASSLGYLMHKRRRELNQKTLLAVGNPDYIPEQGSVFQGGRRYENALRDIYLDGGFELSSLPHTRKEVHRVARCFPGGQVDVLLESQANEESIKSRSLKEYQIIHFACHGFLDEQFPQRSALVLTLDNDSEEDGFLQAHEIANLQLDAELVVLSACQTGKGRLENAEGVFGLPRMFFYAGARSTISSLWKINDKSTSEIMPEFYRHLAAGGTKVRSLRLAKLDMMKSRFSHPFHWAAFVLNGDYL